MQVVIVESPAKCKTINKYLGKDYKVLASFGHIRDLPSKDGMVETDNDFAMHYQIADNAKKNVKEIVDAVKAADGLLLATDPDREGEAISWHVLEALKEKKALKDGFTVKRISFNSITKKAVLDALENPRDIDMDLVNAQQARRALDYLVGFSLSPVLWRKLPGSRSAGRVQSVALRVLCKREKEIEEFINQEYWDVKADGTKDKKEKFQVRLTHLEGDKLEKFSLPDEKSAKHAESIIKAGSFKVSKVEKKQQRRNPQAPFTTSTLQQEASRKLGFGAKKTMMLAQQLYEGIAVDGGDAAGLITYMRTDGVSVAPEAIQTTRTLIGKEYGENYLPQANRVYQSKAANAQEAHEAIRPTDPTLKPATVARALSADQLKLYELIWKRMIASQMESAVLDQVAVDISSSDGKAVMRANGSTIRFDGFLKLYRESRDDDGDDADDDSRLLPPLSEGDAIDLTNIDPAQHFTEPPPRYTEASLVKHMEELGIGRPSTYASILSILQERGYAKLEKKRFFPEPRGRVVTSFLVNFFSKYVEYDFTAHLEEELDDISAGKLEWKKVLEQFWKEFSVTVEDAKKLEVTNIITTLNQSLDTFLFPGDGPIEARRKCPSCDEGKLSLKTGKFGSFLGCSNYPECTFTRPLVKEEGDNEESVAIATEPKLLGKDDDGFDVFVKRGPYGFYVQRSDDKDKENLKRSSLPKDMNPEDVDLAQAKRLLTLPREVGKHPETGKKITAAIGRFGPYVKHDKTYASLKEDSVLDIGINRAVVLLAEKALKSGAEPLKVLGEHPKEKGEVAVYDGRYGPYVKHGKINATLPKDADPKTITMEEAVDLIAAKAKKPTKKKAAKKKPAKKKTAAKKTTKKKS
jgi:DNA topoisomerase-1